MISENLVTIKTYMFPSEAYGLMSKLESEGIECFLDGENTVSVHPFLSNAIGGVKLNIRESDVEDALKIIKQHDTYFTKNNPDDNTIPESFQKGYVKVETFCPECDSMNIYRKKFPLYLTILAILLAPFYLTLVFMTKKHHCSNCNHTWKQ